MIKGKRKIYFIGILFIMSVLIIVGIKIYFDVKERENLGRIEEEKEALEMGYRMQNSAFVIGETEVKYYPYNKITYVNSLTCYLYCYNMNQKNEIYLKDIENYLAEQYLSNGEPKTYFDDPKIEAYVEWWSCGGRDFALSFISNIQRIIDIYSWNIDLEEFEMMDDEYLILDVPLYKIRELQLSFQKEEVEYEDADLQNVSEETLELAFEIYEILKEAEEIE